MLIMCAQNKFGVPLIYTCSETVYHLRNVLVGSKNKDCWGAGEERPVRSFHLYFILWLKNFELQVKHSQTAFALFNSNSTTCIRNIPFLTIPPKTDSIICPKVVSCEGIFVCVLFTDTNIITNLGLMHFEGQETEQSRTELVGRLVTDLCVDLVFLCCRKCGST